MKTTRIEAIVDVFDATPSGVLNEYQIKTLADQEAVRHMIQEGMIVRLRSRYALTTVVDDVLNSDALEV